MSSWTASEISARLGISTAVFQNFRLGERHIAQLRKADITRIELSSIPRSLEIHNRVQIAELQKACEDHGVSVVSVHGPFKLPYNNPDEAVRKSVVEESLAAVRFAAEMGASIYVAHFGYQDHGKKTITELLNATEDLNIRLTTENQTGQPFQPYIDAVDDIGSDRFGMIVDIGHARDADGVNPFVKHDVSRQTLAQCGSRLFHVHLHETFDLAQKPDHHPPMHKDGLIEWGEVFAALKDIHYSGALIFEDGRGEDPEEWIRHTAEFPQAFEKKYET
jgi:sugar phosphate isomerase/epimerase